VFWQKSHYSKGAKTLKKRLVLILPPNKKTKTKINFVLKKEISSRFYGFNSRPIRNQMKMLLKISTLIIHLITGVWTLRVESFGCLHLPCLMFVAKWSLILEEEDKTWPMKMVVVMEKHAYLRIDPAQEGGDDWYVPYLWSFFFINCILFVILSS